MRPRPAACRCCQRAGFPEVSEAVCASKGRVYLSRHDLQSPKMRDGEGAMSIYQDTPQGNCSPQVAYLFASFLSSSKPGRAEKVVSIYQDTASTCSGCMRDRRGSARTKTAACRHHRFSLLPASRTPGSLRSGLRQKRLCLFIKTPPLIAQDARAAAACQPPQPQPPLTPRTPRKRPNWQKTRCLFIKTYAKEPLCITRIPLCLFVVLVKNQAGRKSGVYLSRHHL